MKILKLHLLSAVLLLTGSANAQFFKAENPSLDVSGAAGVSCYYGDLVQKAPIFRDPSLCMSIGLAYNYNPHLILRSDFSYLQVKGSDSKNSRADLKARNLNFKSNIWDFNVSVEYNVLDITGDHKITPYFFLGIGVFHFNPTTKDRNGNKVNLQEMGTEGQGLAAYPDRKPYDRTLLQIPFGGGLKYVLNEKIILGLEFKYRYIDTDYLDDVSMSGYPSQALLAAKNPNLPKLTYRGDELPGGAPYPAPTLNRGNPNNLDMYYSGQFKIIYRIKNYDRVNINY